ncbi:MAG: CDGSH iron-sulfur domain-containing protein [Anaerolineae bacterium]|jgi:CDGSH-type Zn-finger protein|nr:CDGSH iron-sulfur domain-containing protein [Anaerolineae bacterium]MDX9830837.1 CDGSH iron-sulfur domain-containing protein [Anaerolineae bacterium]
MPITIKGRENGPYMIPGQADYVDIDGERRVTQGKLVTLCRCGGSCNKPFCDGMHRRIGFQAPQVELTLSEVETPEETLA